MTNKEALMATVEFGYTNENLFEKVLLDQGLTTSGTYTRTNERSVDLAAVKVYTYLMAHPKVQEGRLRIEFSPAQLKMASKKLLDKYDLSTSTLISAGYGQSINCEPIW